MVCAARRASGEEVVDRGWVKAVHGVGDFPTATVRGALRSAGECWPVYALRRAAQRGGGSRE